jgi:hypothetical protein
MWLQRWIKSVIESSMVLIPAKLSAISYGAVAKVGAV